jgi:hypothetical protein
MQHTHKGRTWTEVRREPYTRKDGGAAELIVWHTKCAKCNAMVEIKTSTKFDTTKAFERVHCSEHLLSVAEVFSRARNAQKARKLANTQPGADLV